MTPLSTPNTRSKRKRGLGTLSEDSPGSELVWTHNHDLRDAVAAAESNRKVKRNRLLLTLAVALDIPAPTQRPRPASARLADSPSSMASPSCGTIPRPSSRSNRKRPCRKSSALPTFNSFTSDASASGSTDSCESLEALLARFERDMGVTAGPERGAKRARSPNRHCTSSRPEISQGDRVPLQSLQRNRPLPHFPDGAQQGRKVCSSKSIANPSSRSGVTTSPLPVSPLPGVGTSTPYSQLRPLPLQPQTKANPINPQLATPHTTTTPQRIRSAPRIGLRTRQPKLSATTIARNCSPAKTLNADSVPGLRSRPLADGRTIKGPPPRLGTRIVAQLSPRLHADHPTTLPSSDGPNTGDESFDSFDGLFESGGAEIEELLKTVDGTQG